MPFWDERFQTMAADYPSITTEQYHIDILTAHFVQHPDWFDVVVGSNLLVPSALLHLPILTLKGFTHRCLNPYMVLRQTSQVKA